jgi:hypothetical protein
MTDDDLRALLTDIVTFEGAVGWLYNDNDRPPNVTIGIGVLISSVTDAQELPLQHADGTPATAMEIAEDYVRVKSMPGGLRSSAYRGALSLSPANLVNVSLSRMKQVLAEIPRVFPGFDGFPRPAQDCLLDLAWNVGLGHFPGLQGWGQLLAACNSVPPDWIRASQECTTSNPSKSALRAARNAWRVACMKAAAGGANFVQLLTSGRFGETTQGR